MELNPTPAELARHRAAIAKLRAELFMAQTLADCFLVPESETVLPLSIDTRVALRDEIRLGGLRYTGISPRPGEWYDISIEHWAHDDFAIFLTRNLSDGRRFTCFAMHRKFSEVAVALRQAVEAARKEDLPWLPDPRSG